MATTIKQRLRRFNGTDYDTVHLETSESQIIADYSKYGPSCSYSTETVIPDETYAANTVTYKYFAPSSSNVISSMVVFVEAILGYGPSELARICPIKAPPYFVGITHVYLEWAHSHGKAISVCNPGNTPTTGIGTGAYVNGGSNIYDSTRVSGGSRPSVTFDVNTGSGGSTFDVWGLWMRTGMSEMVRAIFIGCRAEY